MYKEYIAERVTDLRIRKNISKYQMSLELGRNKSYIHALTSGRCLPSMQQFLEICEYFDITPEQFFDTGLHNLPPRKGNGFIKATG